MFFSKSNILNSSHEVLKIIHGCNIVIVGFKLDIRIDEGKSICCSLYFGQARLMRLEEESIHVCQFNFVIIKQNQLYKRSVTINLKTNTNLKN